MENLIAKFPSKSWTFIILIIGLIIFLPLYTYIFWLLKRMEIDLREFTSVWISFDIIRFKEFAFQIDQHGHYQAFISCYYLNTFSVIGYMCIFTSLTLMIARKTNRNSRFHQAAFIIPAIVMVVGFLDIASNLTLIAALSNLEKMTKIEMFIISGTYVSRSLLFYLVILWIIVSVILIVRKKMYAKRIRLTRVRLK